MAAGTLLRGRVECMTCDGIDGHSSGLGTTSMLNPGGISSRPAMRLDETTPDASRDSCVSNPSVFSWRDRRSARRSGLTFLRFVDAARDATQVIHQDAVVRRMRALERLAYDLRLAGLRAAVLAVAIVEAFGADEQIVQHSIVQDRFFDYPRNILDLDVPVKDPLRINRDARSMLALIETAGRVRSHERPQPARLHFRLERISQRLGPLRITTPARMPRRSLIAADKQMMRKRRHEDDSPELSLSFVGSQTFQFSVRDLIERHDPSVSRRMAPKPADMTAHVRERDNPSPEF